MNKSDDIKELLKAMFSAQKEIPHIPMNGFNPHFKSKFAKLEDIIGIVKTIYQKHSLMISQLPFYGDKDCPGVETVIFHVDSGQWISARVESPAKPDPQSTGAAITYLRRFGLTSMLFLIEDDDDGESAQKSYRPTVKAAPATPKLSNDTLDIVMDLISIKGASKELQEKMLLWAGVTEFDCLTEEQAKKIIARLESI